MRFHSFFTLSSRSLSLSLPTATKFMTLTTIHQFIAEVFNAAGAGEVKTKSFSSQKTASSEAFQVGASQTRYFSGGFLGRQNEA